MEMMEQMSLFDDREVYNPLASRLRPDDLDGFVGQEHLLGKGKILRQLIEQDKIPSMIFLWDCRQKFTTGIRTNFRADRDSVSELPER